MKKKTSKRVWFGNKVKKLLAGMFPNPPQEESYNRALQFINNPETDKNELKKRNDELTQINEKLTREIELFRLGLKDSTVILFNQDINLRYTWIYNPNPGFSAESVLGNTDEKLLSAEEASRLTEIKTRVLKTGVPFRGEVQTTIKNKPFKYELFAEPLKDSLGNIIGVSCVSIDITERKKTEEALKNSEERFRLISENTADTIAVFDLELNHLFVSNSVFRLLGYTPDEVISRGLKGLLTPGSYENAMQLFSSELMLEATGKADPTRSLVFENEEIRKDGATIHVETKISFIRDTEGKLKNILTVTTDITERKKAEEKIKKSEEQLELFFSQSLDGFFFMMLNEPVEWNETTDKEQTLDYVFEHQRVTKANQAILDQYGATKEQFIGLTPAILFEHDIKHGREVWKDFFDKGLLHIDTYEKKLDGTDMIIEGDYICLYDSEKRITGHFGIQREVTEVRNVIQLLKESKSELNEYFENDISADYLISPEGEIYSCNKTFIELFGFEHKSHTEKFNITSLYKNPDDRKKIVREIKKTGRVENYEVEFESLQGNIIYALINAIGIFNDSGKLINIRGYVIDITKRKLAEEAVLKLSRSVEQSPVSIIITDIKGAIEYVNPKVTEITGYEAVELIGQNPRIFKSGERSKKEYQELWETISSGKEWFGEFRNKKKNGEIFWESASISPIKDSSGIITHYVAVKENITDKKRFNETQKILLEISQSTAKHNSLFDFLSEVHKKIRQVVRADNFYVGLHNEKDDTFTFPYHVDEYDEIELNKPYKLDKSYTEFVLKTNQSLIITPEYKLDIEKDGSVKGIGNEFSVWLGVPLQLTPGGKAFGILAIQDYKNMESYSKTDKSLTEIIANYISLFIHRLSYMEDLVKAKEKAEESQMLFETIFDNAPIGLSLFNGQSGKFLNVNKSYCELLGYLKNEIDGLDFMQISYPEDLPADLANMDKLINGEINRFDMEKRLYSKSGQIIHTKLTVVPLRFSKIQTETFLSIVQDISKDKKMIAQLEKNNFELLKAKQKAEESDRLKSAFLANMSHEIRTPMNGILGFTDLLLKPDLKSEEKETYINIVHKSGQRMLNTVNDIVEISKIEAGLTQIKLTETDVNETMKEIFNFFLQEATKKGLNFILEKLLSVEKKTLLTDSNKLDSILTNLIKNAIKYTNSGEITLGCQSKGSTIEFYIKDTGIGIPVNRQEAIFERFIQTDIADTRSYEGSGLGLAICKSYVEMLGGKIWVESREGKGSEFYFTLPVKSNLEEKPITDKNYAKTAAKAKSLYNSLKILIVEDDEASRDFLRLLVNNLSHEILEAATGKEAIELCQNHNDIDLVLMDIRMPELDGYEATRTIREFNKNVIIIAQTAFAISDDRDKALEAGCNDYISKPIIKNVLLAIIEKYFKNPAK